MRIVIDMQGAQTGFSAHRGVGRYTIGLVKGLLAENKRHEIFLALNGAYPESVASLRRTFRGLIAQCNIRVWRQSLEFSAISKESHARMRMAILMREAFILGMRPDIVFSTNLQEGLFESAPTGVKELGEAYCACTTMHDVIPLSAPQTYLADPKNREWYLEKVEGVRRSDIVLTVSEYSRREILTRVGVDANKVVVVPNAVDHERFYPSELEDQCVSAFRARLGVAQKFIVYAGGADLHKDLATLYRAYALLPEELRNLCDLVLIGKEVKHDEGSIRASLSGLGVRSGVVIPGHLSDDDLRLAFSLASVFVFPSIQEGFGLPPLEAMACGAPVLVSSAPALVEVVGLEKAVFPVGDAQALSQKIADVLRDDAFARELREHGVRRAGGFTWGASARKLLDVFDTIAPRFMGQLQGGADSIAEACIARLGPLLRKERSDEAMLVRIALDLDANLRSFPPRPKRLFLDISAIIVNGDHTGIQRVVRAVAAELLRSQSQELEVTLVRSRIGSDLHFRARDFEARWLGDGSWKELTDSELVDFCAGDVLLYLDLHPALAIAQASRNAELRGLGVGIYHVVYDLLPAKFPEFFWPTLCDEFKSWLRAILNSSGALCISNAVASELKQWVALNGDAEEFQVGWFHLGADLKSSVPSKGIPADGQKVLARLRNAKAFLMVGTIEPRKGQEQVLDAFECLWARGSEFALVIVGKPGWGMAPFIERIQEHAELGKKLFWFASASDEYLDELYAACTCLVAASFGEGFGLPIIEAARHGLPIIARDIPVFREIARNSAYYFSAEQPEQLAAALQEWTGLFEIGAQPRPGSLPWLTWQESANMLLERLFSMDLAESGSAVHWLPQTKASGVAG